MKLDLDEHVVFLIGKHCDCMVLFTAMIMQWLASHEGQHSFMTMVQANMAFTMDIARYVNLVVSLTSS